MTRSLLERDRIINNLWAQIEALGDRILRLEETHAGGGSVSSIRDDYDEHDAGTATGEHDAGAGDHTHQSAGAQGGQLDHGAALTGLGDDDHAHYLNTARHDVTARHSLGSVVPHDDHGALSGLGDDDHAIYALASGARDITGDQMFQTGIHVGGTGENPATGQITATVAVSGWVPFVLYEHAPYNQGADPARLWHATISRDIEIKEMYIAVYVVGTNDGSNYWGFDLRDMNGSLHVVTTSAISPDTWTMLSVTGLSTTKGTADMFLYIRATQVGSPGNFYASGPAVFVK